MPVAEDATPDVVVRYWAAARAAAGRPSDEVNAGTLAAVLDQVRRLRPDDQRFDRVVSVCSVLVNQTPVGSAEHAEIPVAAGSVVELLPPFAGG
ncbi:MAG: MoaD/ThiS family protein [Nocardioidaceae bacterium]|jgi:molybdopterin converting factor small subunit|nr:MoaD/ThiS family protein [Nocardioidaceae bacterium]